MHEPALRVRLAHAEVPALVLWGTTVSWTSNIEGASQPVFQVPASKLLLRPDIFLGNDLQTYAIGSALAIDHPFTTARLHLRYLREHDNLEAKRLLLDLYSVHGNSGRGR